MRIVHALAPGPAGGLERVVQMLAVSQADAGHRVIVVAAIPAGDGPHPFVDELDGGVVEIVALELPDRAWAREVRLLSSAIRRIGPDVVHTHGYRADVLAGFAATRNGIPRVSTAHGFTGGGLKNRVYQTLQVASYRRRGQVISVSSPLFDELRARGVPDRRLHLVRNAWRPSEPFLDRSRARRDLGLPVDAGRPIIGFVGRLSEEKGPDVVLDALALADGVSLAFVGGGSEEAALKARADALGVADRVTWHGWVSRADLRIAAFDMIVLSSRTEGTPIILLEAMAAGVPVVAADVGGVPDVVRDGVEGLLVPPEDPPGLARAMQACLADPEAAAARVRAGRRRIEAEFGVASWVARHAGVYEQARREMGHEAR